MDASLQARAGGGHRLELAASAKPGGKKPVFLLVCYLLNKTGFLFFTALAVIGAALTNRNSKSS